VSLRGVIPPLVTPFHADGGLDLEAFSSSLEALAAHDFAGFLALGSTGEAGSLDEDEKLSLVAAARRTAPGRFLLVGSGLESTRATVAFTQKVADLGADAVLVLTPCYYKNRMTSRRCAATTRRWPTRRRCRSTSTPCPRSRACPGPPSLTPALAKHPRIRGIKESSGDINLFARITASVSNGFESPAATRP
jgi:4-hydroxy-2-oxoglutarate aldolase